MESKTPLCVTSKSKWSAKIPYKEVNYPAAKNVNGGGVGGGGGDDSDDNDQASEKRGIDRPDTTHKLVITWNVTFRVLL